MAKYTDADWVKDLQKRLKVKTRPYGKIPLYERLVANEFFASDMYRKAVALELKETLKPAYGSNRAS